MSPRHQEALAHLLYGINSGGGFVALTGEVGTGKTTLCRRLFEQIPDDIDIALILNPKLNSLGLLASIFDELSIRYPADCSSLKSYTDLLNQHLLSAHSRGRRTVLMIDEAQNLDFEVLEQIRLLTNLETSETKLLQIILVGQPELKQLLESEQLRQLNQRVTARYHLKPLSLSETKSYIKHRLSVSGGNPDIFTNYAIRKVYRLSTGIPRIINVLCDRSLLGAYSVDHHRVNTLIVTRAAAEILPDRERRFRLYAPVLWATVAAFAAGGAGFYYLGIPSQPANVKALEQSVPAKSKTESQNTTHDLARQTPSDITTPRPPNSQEPVASAAPLKFDEKPPVDEIRPKFDVILRNSELNIDRALFQLLQLWNLDTPEGSSTSCDRIKTLGLRCLPSSGTWYDIVNFNRPVILEIPRRGGSNGYVALSGLPERQAEFRIEGEQFTFDLGEVLSQWQGFYLLVWKPPQPNLIYLRPGQNSRPILWLRETLDRFDNQQTVTDQPQFFDNELKGRVIAFQKSRHLVQDGVVGPKTLVHLKNTLTEFDFPQLNTIDVLSADTGSEPVAK